jgi:hypothetical protein
MQSDNTMTEEFLQYVWQYRMYSPINLSTQCNQAVEVIHPGEINHDAGPDFFNAKIKIDGTLWVGNVEVHMNSSEWNVHGHQTDKAYDNVILHVVENDDALTYRSNGELIPILKLFCPDYLYTRYCQLKNSNQWLACADKLHLISYLDISLWLQRVLVERLEQKAAVIRQMLEMTTSDWDETFYRLLFRSFGFGVNGEPFERLARSIPLNVMLKYSDDIQLTEALLFGQAGFLKESHQDSYLRNLYRDYCFLQQKHQLKGVDNHLWKFLRLRPSNFPTVRLSQLANLLLKLKGVFGKIVNEPDVQSIRAYLSVQVSEYWQTHYLPGKKSEKKLKKLGESSKNLIIINTVIPMVFAYGKSIANQQLQDRVLDWLAKLKPEKNSLLNEWEAHKIFINNAGDSQALIYLSKNYCKQKKCLCCRIGHQVLTINNK